MINLNIDAFYLWVFKKCSSVKIVMYVNNMMLGYNFQQVRRLQSDPPDPM